MALNDAADATEQHASEVAALEQARGPAAAADEMPAVAPAVAAPTETKSCDADASGAALKRAASAVERAASTPAGIAVAVTVVAGAFAVLLVAVVLSSGVVEAAKVHSSGAVEAAKVHSSSAVEAARLFGVEASLVLNKKLRDGAFASAGVGSIAALASVALASVAAVVRFVR
jgi:hypothetical protein